MLRRIVLSVPACLSVLSVLSACATRAPMGPGNPDQVSIHESVVGAPPRYEVVKRLWAESWRSALRVPTYASSEDAMADFRRQAARLGGNGVINFGCYHLPGASGTGTRLACNGTIVRFL